MSSESWRKDFRRIYREFSVVNSPSYRASSAVLNRRLQQQHHPSGDQSGSGTLSQTDFSVTSSTLKSSFTLGTLVEGSAIGSTRPNKMSLHGGKSGSIRGATAKKLS